MDLIESLRRNFKRHQLEQEKEGFAWEQWQAAKLRELIKYRKETSTIVDGYSDEIEDTIRSVLKASFGSGNAKAEKEILNILFPADIKGSKLKVALPETSFFGVNKQKLQALGETVVNDIQKAEHAVLRKMEDVYRQTIYRAEMSMSSGAQTLNQAVDNATREFLDAGIQCIEYKDGRKVNVSSYAEMALRTASQRATFMGEGQKRNEWGVYTVVVSAHASSCDLCLPWQAEVLIDDVYAQGKPDGIHKTVSEAMEAGLFHPNCRHLISTWFPGISILPRPIDEETAKHLYDAERKQRYIERQIQRWKRREAGSLDPQNQQEAGAKVKEWQAKMRQHLEDNPQLRRDLWRERPRIENSFEVQRALSSKAGGRKVSDWKDRHANLMYEEIRKRKTDVAIVAKNIGWNENSIHEIKQHMFIREHLLDGEMSRFAPDFEQVQAWDRLTQGKYTPADILLLKHEYLELTLMRVHGYNYDKAHSIANELHNWAYLVEKGGR